MKYSILFLALAVPLAAQAVPPETLTIERAVSVALEKNLSLERNAIDLDAKKRQNDHAFGVLSPTLSASSSLARNNNAFDAMGGRVNPSWSQSVTYGVSFTIAAGALANIAVVKTNYQSGLLTYDDARRVLERDVRTSFYALLLQQENIKLQEQSIERSEKQYEQILANFRAGLVPDLDVMTAEVSLASLKPDLDRLKLGFHRQLGQFMQLLDIDRNSPIELNGTLDQFTANAIDLTVIRGNESAALRSLRLALTATEQAQLAQQLSTYVPNLSLSWNASPARADVFGRPSQWTDNTGGITLALGYTFSDFLPWSAAAETISGYRDQIRKYRTQILDQIRTQELDRETNILQIQQSINALKALGLNVVLAQKAYDQSVEAYKRGVKDLVTLQGAEGDLQKSRYNVLSERYTLLTTILNLEYEENLPFGTILGGQK